MVSHPYKGNNADIERIANSFRDAVLQRVGDGVLRGRKLLETTVSLIGGRIQLVDDPSRQEVEGGSLIIRRERDFTIYLSPYTTPLRDNFTIAHEVGHLLLHFFLQKPRPQTPVGFTRYGSGSLEWQANRFAAALLMPEQEFREKYTAYGGDGFLLSGYFEVSRPAVEARAESLSCTRRSVSCNG
jgi:Zn-dependent peptidase ImmA (M78 family)